MKLKSKFFRIAVAGDTTDGRVIEADWLTQMAKNYNPEKYMARVNCEHIRGYSPEGPFGMYGNVDGLKTDAIEIDGEKKVALFAAIEPTPELVALNRKGQKLFTSMEIDPDFAKKGEFYLSGLAITDSPASLGTEMLQFAANAEINPLATRKQKPENMFSVASEVSIELVDESSILDKVKTMFKKSNADQSGQNQDFTQAIEVVAGEVTKLSERIDTINVEDPKSGKQIEEMFNEMKTIQTEINEFKSQLENTPNFTKRPPADGGKGEALTDC